MKDKVYISLGNENQSDNKVVLNGKEIDLSKVNYFVLECRGNKRNWIIGRHEISLQTQIRLIFRKLTNGLINP